VAVLLPLIYTSPLPARQLLSRLVGPPPPSGPRVVTVVKARQTAPAAFEVDRLVSPAVIPRRVAIVEDTETGPPPAPFPGVRGSLPRDVLGDGYGSVIGAIALPTPIPPSPPPTVETPKAAPTRIRVSSGVQKSKQIYAPLPVYPELA